jgi:hypothetical protein
VSRPPQTDTIIWRNYSKCHCLPTSMMMPPDDDATTTLAPQEERMTPPVSCQSSSHHEIQMAQLQMELVHAMADRVEIEIKISIVRAQIMAEEELQAREIFYHQQRSSLHQQPLQQQLEEYNRVRRTLPVCSSLKRGPNEKIPYYTNSTTNGLMTAASPSVAASVASMLPPMSLFGMTRRIPEAEEVVVVTLPPSRMQWSDQGKEEDSTIEDNTAAAAAAAAAVAVGGWVRADNTSSSIGTSKRAVSSTNKNNDKEVSNKRRRVVESIDCLLTLVNHRRRAATANNNNNNNNNNNSTIQSSLQQDPTTTSISITNHCRMRPLTYAGRGIQW